MNPVVRRADARTTVTPNATMTTLASPSVGGSDGRSLWLVEMMEGARGPLHVFDSEQIWTVLEGRATFQVAGASQTLDPGDTVVIPAHAQRQIHAVTPCRMLVTGGAGASVTVVGEQEPRGTPAWIS